MVTSRDRNQKQKWSKTGRITLLTEHQHLDQANCSIFILTVRAVKMFTMFGVKSMIKKFIIIASSVSPCIKCLNGCYIFIMQCTYIDSVENFGHQFSYVWCLVEKNVKRVNRVRQLYKNISMLFLFPVKDGKLSTGVKATFDASCYGQSSTL